MKLVIPIAKITTFLLFITPTLGVLGFASEFLDHLFGLRKLGGLVPLFNLSSECNIPNWYASTLLIACAITLACIAGTKSTAHGEFKGRWIILSLIFLYISMDETAQIHELVNAPLRNALGLGGVFYYAWVIPAFFLLLIFGFFYLKFLFHLPPRFQKLFALSGLIYVGGAFGTEFFVNYWVATYDADPVYGMLNVVQEVMELSGLSIFLYSTLHYLKETAGTLKVSFA